MEFPFSVSAPSVFYPDKSYLKVELELYGPGDSASRNAPTLADGLAFAENCVANSITNCYFYGGNAIISAVTTAYPQVHALASRTSKTAAWLRNQGSSYAQCGTLSERIAAVAATTTGGAPVGLSGLDNAREEVYKPGAQSNAATLEIRAAPAPGLSAAAPIVIDDIDDPTADTVVAIGTTVNELKDAVVTAVNTLNGELKARDVEAAGRAVTRTLVSGPTAGGTATLFRNGALDAGVVIKFTNATNASYDTFTIVSVVTAGDGIQTITATGGAGGPAVAASSQWYAVRRNLRRSAEARHKISVLMQPALGIFQLKGAMRPGSYRLSLSLDPNYRLNMVETRDLGYALTGADMRYKILVKDIKFYASIAKLSLKDNIVGLDLVEFEAIPKAIQSASGSFQFTVKPSTSIIYVCLQHKSAGSNPAWPPSKFIAGNDSDLNLRSLQLTYGGVTKTMVRWKAGLTAGYNGLVQLYNMSLQETGRDNLSGGAESFNDWLEKGPIYAFSFPRDGGARDTELSLTISYENSEAYDGTVPTEFDVTSKLFVITEYHRTCHITHSRGQITEVISRDV